MAHVMGLLRYPTLAAKANTQRGWGTQILDYP